MKTGMIVLALAANLLGGCTLEQLQIGQVYAIGTPAAGACPRLVWRFVVNPQRAINGSLSSDGQQPIANLSGQLNSNDSFQMTATDLAGGQTTSVTGQFTSLLSTISVHGNVAGGGCDGQVFTLQLGGYFSRQSGGSGGGG